MTLPNPNDWSVVTTTGELMDIRKAVELADGWSLWSDIHFNEPGTEYVESSNGFWTEFDAMPENNVLKDSLAAQLVRQVDLTHNAVFMSRAGGTAIVWPKESTIAETRVEGPDRTENTISAIVKSGVLEK